ncbi:hypothetical protein C8Q74DRAFT_1367032 [Fomes fomentarius]|nr:hypothetical protein C8Q74DRAFT_1367032 [Fomes fomentarius]
MAALLHDLRFQHVMSQLFSTEGRSLDDLLKTDDTLSGAESQRLRLHFSSARMIPPPWFDDSFGNAVYTGDLTTLKKLHADKLTGHLKASGNEEAARAATVKDIYEMRWNMTGMPIFDVILLSITFNSRLRPSLLQTACWLIDDIGIPVDGRDLSGSTALHYAISSKRKFDAEYAQILYEAGGSVTDRNRCGSTPAHDLILEHGGNLDVKDTDGVTPREAVDVTRQHAARDFTMEMWRVVDDEDRRRERLAGEICAFCGCPPRDGVGLIECAKCQSVRYCSAPLDCQKTDWPHHEPLCKTAE